MQDRSSDFLRLQEQTYKEVKVVFLSPSDHSSMSNSVDYSLGYSTRQRARIISLAQVNYYVSTCLILSVLCFCIFCSFG